MGIYKETWLEIWEGLRYFCKLLCIFGLAIFGTAIVIAGLFKLWQMYADS